LATLTVGTGQQYATIAAAVAASKDGDVLAVQAGTYTNDFATITKDITIQAVGGVAKLVATVAPPNGKAILITRSDVTIQGLEFTGAKVPDGNGAGIRFEGGNLTILDSHFHHNQDGLLGGSYPDGTITIRRSEFGHNGAGDGKTHGIYVGKIKSLVIEDSYFHDTRVGHEIKSRAIETVIRNSRIQDEDGTTSYSIDLPNGGNALLENNVIQQGAKSQNPAMVHFGGEGTPYAGSSLVMTDNVVINNLSSVSAKLLLNQTTYGATISGTDVFGLAANQIANSTATVSGTTFLSVAPSLDTTSPWSAFVSGTGGTGGGDAGDTTGGGTTGESTGGGSTGGAYLGTAANDVLTLDAPVTGATVDLLDGSDRLVLSSAGPNSLSVANVERIIGGSAADSVTLTTAAKSAIVDLGGGADRLQLATGVANSVTVSNVETILGGSAADAVTFATAVTGATLDLGGGVDRVKLSSLGANSVTVTQVESVTGGTQADRIALAAGSATLDGSGGNDTLLGNAGADRLIGGTGVDVMTGGGGADRFVFRAGDSAVATPDHITDFQAGVDDLVFLGMLRGGFEWRGGAAFSAEGHSEARMGAGTALLLVDADGNGTADLAVNLAGGNLASLGAGDFIWT
jgi:Ca2+-binding RTX toxin-like protein